MNSRIEKACYQIVLNAGSVPKDELDKVFLESEKSKSSFTELLVRSGLIREDELLAIFSKGLGTPVVDLKTIRVDKAMLERVPIKFAWYYKFFPIKLNEKRLTIAISHLLDVNTLDEIRLGLGYEIDIALAREKDIEEMLKRFYGLGAETVDKILSQSSGEASQPTAQPTDELEDIEKLVNTASVVQLVNQIILDAYKKRASDIHIEPSRGKVRLRYRIDGMLHEARVPPEMKQFFTSILSRIKIMANLNIVERRLPQDGKARVKTQDQSLDLRISSIPTPHGESMVIRILPSKMIYSLEELGLEPEHMAIFKDLLKKPHGIIFVTGPTGSGKSTTLYAGLRAINTIDRKVITIEDPIEYEMDGMTQIQVLPEIGLTFARGLRSMLRHDPDVMMVGEVRDFETADIAIRVALTGHLILSTLHTNDAASGITRLLDIGVEPYLISSSVVAFMAQRLIRVICPHCKVEDAHVPAELRNQIREELSLSASQNFKIYMGKGCDECYRTGYLGRVGIHEIILLNEEIRQMIFSRANADQIRTRAKELGMTTLRQDGWKKVLKGVTTPKEVIKATSADEKAVFLAEPALAERVVIEKPNLNFDDRRKYERIKVSVSFAYRVVEPEGKEAPPENQKEQGYLGAQTENISAGGLSFLTQKTFKPGTLIDLKLELPNTQTPIQCLGRVLRVSRTLDSLGPEGKFQYRVAVPFIAINSLDRSQIESFCNATRAIK